eukprot:371473_1
MAELKLIKPETFNKTTHYTIDEAISHIGNGKFQYQLMLLTGGIWAADAMEMMLLSFVMPILKDEWSLASPLDGAISSVVFAGMLVGTAFWSICADKIGRKKVVLVSNLGCAIFGALSGLVPNIYLMLIARFLVGFSVGGSGTAYTLFAEYAPQEVRGSLLVIEQGFWSFGAIFSVMLAWFSLINLNWRWYMILSSIPLFIISILTLWIQMPESSRWLLACGKVQEAEKVLQHVAHTNGTTLPDGHLAPVQISQRGNPLDTFNREYRVTSILLYISFFMCVFGYYGICFISVKFYEGDVAGSWRSSKTYWQSLISASSELPGLVIGVYILDRIGRKRTLLMSFGLFALSTFCLMFESIQNSTALGVSCVFSARMAISLGFMAIYIYFSEYYPTAIRSTSLGMASAAGRVAGMLTSIVSEDTPFTVGILLYVISGAIAFVCTLFIGETMGRVMATSVEEVPHSIKTYDDTYRKNIEMQIASNTQNAKEYKTLNAIASDDTRSSEAATFTQELIA